MASQQRPQHPCGVVVAFKHLGQAVAELTRVLFSPALPRWRYLLPHFTQFETNGEVHGRLGGAGHCLMARTTVWRTAFCSDVSSVLQYRCQEVCKITCALPIAHRAT